MITKITGIITGIAGLLLVCGGVAAGNKSLHGTEQLFLVGGIMFFGICILLYVYRTMSSPNEISQLELENKKMQKQIEQKELLEKLNK